jgi:hypothetical protein
MLTVKFVKYLDNRDDGPTPLEGICLRQAKAVHVIIEKDGRQVVQCGDAPGETFEATVGPGERCSYGIAYVMNDAGKTVETIR